VFTYQQRIKAVELYIKYGLKAAATTRDLGYPTRRSLQSWYREYRDTGDLHRDITRKSRFTNKQKSAAVEHFIEHGRNMAFTIRELGYPHPETLRQWIDAQIPGTRMASIQHFRHEPFSEDEKRQAVIDLCTRDGSVETVAAKVGISRTHLYTWRHQLLGNKKCPVKKSPKQQKDSENHEELQRELDDLQGRVQKLQMEHAILLKANELLRKEQGINLRDLTNREKTLLIDALRDTYRVVEQLEVLSMPRSSYFYHHSRLKLPDRYQEVRSNVGRIFDENHRVYGYRRIHMMFRRIGIVVSEKVIRRIMAEEQLVVLSRRKRRYNAYRGEITPAVPNIVQRNFHAEVPSQKWLTDITEFQVSTAKVYLSPLIDCFDGMVVSWTIGTSLDAELVNTMLDSGVHYRWPGWIDRMIKAGLTRSMSKKGCTPDNAACEGFFGRLKSEMYYNRSWRNISVERFIELVDEYIR
jgi:putative transposase